MPVSVTDALGNTTQFAYDGADLVGFTDSLGNTTTRFVDAAGRSAAITDPLGRATKYSYNALNQIVQTVDPVQGVTSVIYDANGNAVNLTNSLGIPAQFGHPAYLEAVDRVLAACRAHGKAAGFMVATAEEARAKLDQGFRCLAFWGDIWIYQQALSAGLSSIRSATARSV